MSLPEQLPLPLPVKSALGREDYFVAPANAMAVALVETWRDWPARKFVLTGPEGAGKTHLAHVWAALADARIFNAQGLAAADIPALAAGCVAVEDVDRVAGQPDAEAALFHLHNLVLANGHALLMTARKAPPLWDLHLPDLQSRVLGTQGAALSAPDDTLLAALLAKMFADRQIVPHKEVIPYLLRRIPRSYSAAKGMVEQLDHASRGRDKGLTRKLAQTVFERWDAAENDTSLQDGAKF